MIGRLFRKHRMHTAWRLVLVLAGAVLMAINIKTFVNAGGLFPGGFTGLTLLIQEICRQYGNFEVSFSVINFTLNLIPAVICYKFIGKKFTLYSILMVVVCGILTDCMPSMFTEHLATHDVLLSAVFGGLLNALAVSLCLYAGATSGGTDFIAIFFSEKCNKDTWNHIFVGNCVVLVLAGYLFGLDKALYSIIFQFATTMALPVLYGNYQQRTLLIVTNKPNEVSKMISDMSSHGATLVDCFGSFALEQRTLLYSVVSASQVKELIPAIRKIDGNAFINVIKTYQLNGFFRQQKFD